MLDDWGYADVEAAAASIPDWIASVGWKGPNVAIDQWLVCGHSNGGKVFHAFHLI